MSDADREILTTRVVDAPRALVFRAWTSPVHLEKWWGPNGFRTSTRRFDFRVGGAWKHTMLGPDGTEYPNTMIFDEIVPNERIVYSHHGGHEGVNALFQMFVTFADEGGKTRVTMRHVFPSREARDAVVERFGAAEGAKQTMARMAEMVGTFADDPSRPEVWLVRTFDARRELVFRAFSTPEHMSRWLPPNGFTMARCRMDFRSGGSFDNAFAGPDGRDYPFSGSYDVVDAPNRIVWSGTIHGDLKAVTTIDFAEHDGKTVLTVHQAFNKDGDPVRGAPIGWGQSLDKLTAILAEGVQPS